MLRPLVSLDEAGLFGVPTVGLDDRIVLHGWSLALSWVDRALFRPWHC